MAQQKKNLSRPLLAAAVVVVLLAAIGIGWMLGRGGSDEPTQPVTASQDSSASTSNGETAGSCGLPAGSDAAPTEAPEATWEVVRGATVPRSQEFGPAKVTDDGDRACYARNPTGALFAAANFVGMPLDVFLEHITPGPYKDLYDGLEIPEPTPGDVFTVRAFKVEPKGPDKVTVTLVSSSSSGTTMTAIPGDLVWEDGDWMVDGTQENQGSTKVTSLDGYVEWGPK